MTRTFTRPELELAHNAAKSLSRWLEYVPATAGALPFTDNLTLDLQRLMGALGEVLTDMDKAQADELTHDEFSRRFEQISDPPTPDDSVIPF